MELKTYVVQYIHEYGNGWAIINACHPSQVENILKNQGRYKKVIVTSFKEMKCFGNTMSIVYDGSITTLGETPYDLAKSQGFEGTLEDWLESLVGPPGPPGPKGEKGERGATGNFIYPVFDVTEDMHLISNEGINNMSVNSDGHLTVDY